MSRLVKKSMWDSAITATVLGTLALTHTGKDEGRRLKAYRDVIGVPTVCRGETKGVKMGNVYTREQCEAMFLKRLDEFGNAVEKCVTKPMSDKMFVAFVGLSYNIGIGGFCKSNTVRLYNPGEREAVCDAMARFNRSGGRVVAGLVSRRARKEAMCLEGLKA